MPHNRLPVVLLLLVVIALAISAVHPADRTTWWLEVAPIFLIVPVLILTARRFPLTNVLYVLIAIHALILMLGGHYTYAQVPFGFWLQDALDLTRNPYDRIGHFAQGFVPAIAAREVLLRQTPLRRGGWLFFIVCFDLPRDQRLLRVHRVVGGRCGRRRGRSIPRHAG